ncbi:hypothetical protein N9414_23493 [Nodularia spumigena CCY9414]|nr:hypothetical protein N9414_23493 [Nodularia spumigena CCY9414]
MTITPIVNKTLDARNEFVNSAIKGCNFALTSAVIAMT